MTTSARAEGDPESAARACRRESVDAAEVVRLWARDGRSRAEDEPEEVAYDAPPGPAEGTTNLRNVSDPTLSVFRPPASAANGVGVVVAPGGGWMLLAWENEGVHVAQWLAANGFTAFLLKYRVQRLGVDQDTFNAVKAAAGAVHAGVVPTAARPTAMSDLVSDDWYLRSRAEAADDGRRAIELAHELAPTYSVRSDAIGVLGFSAGAFLAVDVALDPRAEPLAFVAAIYGGETCGRELPADAPPLFSVVAHDDVLRRIVEGLYVDWSAADRPAELHVFARGNHGFGVARQGAPSDRWPELLLAWLADLDVLAR